MIDAGWLAIEMAEIAAVVAAWPAGISESFEAATSIKT